MQGICQPGTIYINLSNNPLSYQIKICAYQAITLKDTQINITKNKQLNHGNHGIIFWHLEEK
jgi:hypothetical protein